MKKILVCLLAALLALSCFTACSDTVIGASNDGSTGAGGAEEAITLNGDSAKYAGGGVSINGSTVTISAPGEYTVTGKLDNGRIIIDTGDDPGDVTLTLDGADITCLTDSAIYVAQAKNVDIVLAPGSTNKITSGTEADLEKADGTASGAAIFAEDDLDIKGEGTLQVCGYINNGITCKDDLDIKGGTITVLAANNGVRGSESVSITGGDLSVTAGNDGIKSTVADKAEKGFVEISGGTVAIAAGGDGISAETSLNISGGNIVVSTTGDPTAVSSKGIKANTGFTVSGGSINVTSTDHALKSAVGMSITGGSFTLSSTDGKGISAEEDIVISGGDFNVIAVDDGIESATAVTIEGGNFSVVAGNDGLKAGEKGTGFEEKVGAVTINGGSLNISAYADPIDAKAQLLVNGGSVLACGTSKSIKNFSAGSAQTFAACSISGSSSDTLQITAADGTALASMAAHYSFNTVLFSFPELLSGSEYTVSAGTASVNVTA